MHGFSHVFSVRRPKVPEFLVSLLAKNVGGPSILLFAPRSVKSIHSGGVSTGSMGSAEPINF